MILIIIVVNTNNNVSIFTYLILINTTTVPYASNNSLLLLLHRTRILYGSQVGIFLNRFGLFLSNLRFNLIKFDQFGSIQFLYFF